MKEILRNSNKFLEKVGKSSRKALSKFLTTQLKITYRSFLSNPILFVLFVLITEILTLFMPQNIGIIPLDIANFITHIILIVFILSYIYLIIRRVNVKNIFKKDTPLNDTIRVIAKITLLFVMSSAILFYFFLVVFTGLTFLEINSSVFFIEILSLLVFFDLLFSIVIVLYFLGFRKKTINDFLNLNSKNKLNIVLLIIDSIISFLTLILLSCLVLINLFSALFLIGSWKF